MKGKKENKMKPNGRNVMTKLYAIAALAFLLMGATLNAGAAGPSPTGIKNVVLVHGAFADGSGWEDGRSCVFGPRRRNRRSARHFGNVDMSDVIDSVTLFPLSNLPLAVRLCFNDCLNETNGGNSY